MRLVLQVFSTFLVMLTAFFSQPVQAADTDVVVIAAANSKLTKLSRDDVANIYMGAYRKLPDGGTAHPIDQDAEAPARTIFYRRLLNKSLEEINAYWVRLTFSGRTRPPESARNATEMLEHIARDPHAIGYIERAQLPRAGQSGTSRDIKILFDFSE